MGGQVEVLLAGLDTFTEGTIVELSLNVTANLQEDTPRDTGWARSNWVPSVGAPALPPVEPDGRPTKSDVAGARGRAEAGLAQVLGYKLNQGSTFATNGVSYIEQLNGGSSQQAPSGFVQRDIEKAIRQTRGPGRRR